MHNGKIIKSRDKSIDRAKGMLIIFLLIGHTIWITKDWNYVTGNTVINAISDISTYCWGGYFMPAFFFITGMCSNFKIKSRIFLKKQFKSLLIPNIFFSIVYCIVLYEINDLMHTLVFFGGCMWFLTALFLGKMGYHILLKYSVSPVFSICILLLLSLSMVFLDDSGLFHQNYWYLKQTFDLTLFLCFGNVSKSLVSKRWSWIAAFLFVGIIVISLQYEYLLPVVDSQYSVDITNWLIHIAFAIVGTISVLKVCKFIRSCALEYIGKKSLIIYILNILLLPYFCSTFKIVYEQNDIESSVICFVSTVICDIVFSLAINKCFENRYLGWIIGK